MPEKLDTKPNKSPTRKRAARLARKGGSLLLIGAAVPFLPGCGNGSTTTVKTIIEKEPPVTSDQAQKTPAALTPAKDFAWAPRVKLTGNTYGAWTPKTPEPVYADHSNSSSPSLLVVDDGRFNNPEDPNPNTDQPTGAYAIPNQEQSQLVSRIPDGTVLKVIGYISHGEPVADAHQKFSPIWEEIVSHQGTTALIPEANLGFTAMSKLAELPQVSP